VEVVIDDIDAMQAKDSLGLGFTGAGQ
jgi:hypothetical protein